MIVFDLRCAPEGHVFEAWFGSGADYEAQRTRGLVQCPLCGSASIDKAPMAPSIGGSEAGPDPKAMLAEMAKLQRKLLDDSDDVGDRFPDEARAIAARQDIASLMQALKLYRLDKRRYPTTEQGLQALIVQPVMAPLAPNWKAGGYLERLGDGLLADPGDQIALPCQPLHLPCAEADEHTEGEHRRQDSAGQLHDGRANTTCCSMDKNAIAFM